MICPCGSLGTRLGLYQVGKNLGWTSDKDGNVSMSKSVLVASTTGAIGATIGSPWFLVGFLICP